MDIFQVLIDENIKFDKSMRRPLILHACFFKSDKFKQFCIKFIGCFGLKWDHSVQVTRSIRDKNGKSRSQYVRNENRSKQLHDSFVIVLRQIRALLNNNNFNITNQIQEGIQNLMQFIQHSLIIKTNTINYSDNNSNNNINKGYGPSHGTNKLLSVKRMRFNPYGLYDKENLNQHDHHSIGRCLDYHSYSDNDPMNDYRHEMKDQFDQYNPIKQRGKILCKILCKILKYILLNRDN